MAEAQARAADPALPDWVTLDWGGRPVRVEYRWLRPHTPPATDAPRPLIVFLHEGLGSLSMWKDWPQRLCDAAGCDGLVYSRPGYGRSTPRAADERWRPDFMHRQAHEVLPALLAALQVGARGQPLWLLGHSDGGSIALLYAARHGAGLAGVIVMAPHIVVEPVTLASIEQARVAYRDTDLRARLARYHDDPDSAFRGWNDIWLDPEFAAWDIRDEIAGIGCPLLAIQGEDDEYGTLEQIRGIARRVPQTRLLALPACRHSPHRDQPDALTAGIRQFLSTQRTGDLT